MKKLLLFDVDGTLVESGQNISEHMATLLTCLQVNGYELGIVGGGKLEKILEQFNKKICFTHYYTECGCVYHKNISPKNSLNLTEVYKKNIRNHPQYENINNLIKLAMNFISMVDYTISGHFIDLRNGIIYISLIGLSATQRERQYFLDIDKEYKYREKLFNLLTDTATKMSKKNNNNISIVYGGSVGIAIYPEEYDKVQIMESIDISNYSTIYYFGDKYLEDGNDYKLLNHEYIISRRIDNIEQTEQLLKNMLVI